MDSHTFSGRAILVNFRAPRTLIETLDQLSRFHHRTRTSILLDLISNWISEKTYEVPFKVQQLKDLKSALNSHEQPTHVDRRSVGTSKLEKASRDGSELIPVRFISSSMIDFDNGGNEGL
jgi:hypothetical protein